MLLLPLVRSGEAARELLVEKLILATVRSSTEIGRFYTWLSVKSDVAYVRNNILYTGYPTVKPYQQ
jgi:hypothetical protein